MRDRISLTIKFIWPHENGLILRWQDEAGGTVKYFAAVHMKAGDSLGSWGSADTCKILIESGSTLDIEATIQEGS